MYFELVCLPVASSFISYFSNVSFQFLVRFPCFSQFFRSPVLLLSPRIHYTNYTIETMQTIHRLQRSKARDRRYPLFGAPVHRGKLHNGNTALESDG
jgi:hypothetical protein